MKTLSIAGRVGKDAILRETANNEKVLGWSVAVNDGYGDKKSTLWFDCTLWGKRGAALEPHIKKGDHITASGELGTREHDGKIYMTLRVNEVELQGGGERQESKPAQKSSYDRDDPRTQSRGEGGNMGDLDDEIPF